MMSRGIGLTSTYNMVNDKGFHDDEVAELRRIHVSIDEEVMRAYGWTDLDLDHDFHETRQGIRYTVGPVARQEILDRLLELNQQRYAEEQAQGQRNADKAHPAAQDQRIERRAAKPLLTVIPGPDGVTRIRCRTGSAWWRV